MSTTLGHRLLRPAGAFLMAAALMTGAIAAPAATRAQASEAHPAHIHVGACPSPGEVVAPLTDVTYPYAAGSDEGVGASETTVKMSLKDIVDGGHAIVVHESKDKIQNYLLCGNVGGEVVNNQIVIGLSPLNNSGYEGVAILKDEGDGTTSVHLLTLDNAMVTGDAIAFDGSATAHPAHVHNGACPNPADVVFPLDDVTAAGGAMAAGATPAAMMGQMNDLPVWTSTTDIKTSLSDLTGSAHSIVAHLSKDQIGTYLVCGDISGSASNNKLAVRLNEVKDSGHIGVALLTQKSDGTTSVALYLMPGIKGGAMASPEAGGEYGSASPAAEHNMEGMGTPTEESSSEYATPASGQQSGAMAVTIKGFAFNPPTLEVPVGTTVTWTNEDTAPHTVSSVDGLFESGRLDTGKTFSYTFDKAGTYNYFCQFHANMKATIVVK